MEVQSDYRLSQEPATPAFTFYGIRLELSIQTPGYEFQHVLHPFVKFCSNQEILEK